MPMMAGGASLAVSAAALLIGLSDGAISDVAKVDHVIHIVVDGLRPDAMSGHPNFDFLFEHGACTGNARLDPLSSQTLPNHISMFTGHPTSDHGYLEDADDGGHLPSGPTEDIFDLVKASSGTTAFFGSKTKFAIFERSYAIDVFAYEKRARTIVPLFISQMEQNPFTYAFLHIRSPDRAGHGDGGAKNDGYREAVAEADEYLGHIRNLVDQLKGHTGIILTADHGFADYGNHASMDLDVYRIPFCVLGPGVAAGADLYDINTPNVVDPGEEQADGSRVIRNVYAGVLAADWLGLHPSYGPLSDQYLTLSDGPSEAISEEFESDSKVASPAVDTESASSSLLASDEGGVGNHAPLEPDSNNPSSVLHAEDESNIQPSGEGDVDDHAPIFKEGIYGKERSDDSLEPDSNDASSALDTEDESDIQPSDEGGVGGHAPIIEEGINNKEGIGSDLSLDLDSNDTISALDKEEESSIQPSDEEDVGDPSKSSENANPMSAHSPGDSLAPLAIAFIVAFSVLGAIFVSFFAWRRKASRQNSEKVTSEVNSASLGEVATISDQSVTSAVAESLTGDVQINISEGGSFNRDSRGGVEVLDYYIAEVGADSGFEVELQ